ncbi:MAG: FRG domain-containing protein [Bacteroidota bacterium]
MAFNGKDVRPESWTELQELLFQDTWDEKIARYRSPFVYRGLGDASYPLLTSLMRLSGPFEVLEHHLLRNFKKYAHRNAVPGDNIWNWLAVAQHHGLPTRLLDWTHSPYVALHFATAKLQKFDRDGVIWCLNYAQNKEYLPPRFKRVMDVEGTNIFTVDMLSEVCNSLRELDEVQNEDFLVFFEPPSLDERIVSQHALFTMLSNNTASLDDYLKAHPDLYFRIIIPAELKWEIRDKLDQANINERVLFPGLDGLSSWLKRHYAPSK